MSAPRFELAKAPLDRGTVLLEASAGTGKTYTLVGILLRLLLEGTIDRVDRALVVTFTVAAADELKNRLRKGLQTAIAACEGRPTNDPFFAGLAHHGARGVRVLRDALDQFDQVAIATIHGFCKRVLDEAAFESREPFEAEFALDELPLWERAAEDALRAVRAFGEPTLGAVLACKALAPEQLVQAYRLWQRNPDVTLEPETADPGPHLRALLEATRAAGASIGGTVCERLLSWRWVSEKSPFAPLSRVAMQRFRATLAQRPDETLPRLLNLTRAAIEEGLSKRRTPRPNLDHPFFDACDTVAAAHANALAHVRSWLLRTMHDRAERAKRRDAVLSFTDLLVRTEAALRDPERAEVVLPSLRARYHVALIDEFQDTDPIQYSIFATCFANRPLFLVGDPKQSIYSFRGADLETYFTARGHAIDTRTLDTNHRSAAAIVRAVELLFMRENAFVDARLQLPPIRAAAGPGQLTIDGDPGAALRWRFLRPNSGKTPLWSTNVADPRIADDVAAEISRLLRSTATIDGRPLRPRDVAVLTRTNRQATLVQDTLRKAGIVSAIGKAGDVFATDEVGEVERLILAVLQPADLMKARSAMATRLFGLSAEALRDCEEDSLALERELMRFERWRTTWIRRGFVVMKEQMLADLDVESRLLATIGGERRLTNFQQLFEMLHHAEHEHHLSPEGVLHWLQRERSHQEETDYQRRELRLESDEDAVQILTVHGSKGLQYEIVFCPFAWSARQIARAPVLVRRDGTPAIEFTASKEDEAYLRSDGERLAEDVRLLYVAITRARRRCYLHWGPIGSNQSGSWRSALGWLLRPKSPDTTRPGWPLTWAEDCKSDAKGYRAELERRVAASDGTMSVDDVPEAPEPVLVPQVVVPDARRTRRATHVPRTLALHSFTSLTAGAAAVEPAPDVTDAAAPATIGIDAPPARGIFAFARGARAGQCLHTILEHADLSHLDENATRQLVDARLRLFGLHDAASHDGEVAPSDDVLTMLRELAATRTHPNGPTLAALFAGAKVAEWPFTLPVPHADTGELQRLFTTHGGALARTYAPRLQSLGNRALRGFLGGFLDLVAEHDGRWYVVDWKSNHLGDATDDYGPAALQKAMFEHDYVLQYHLYLLALHRHLARRVPDYAPERHLGGACYPFLRGVRAGDTNGIFFDRPPTALVVALDRWAEGGGRRP